MPPACVTDTRRMPMWQSGTFPILNARTQGAIIPPAARNNCLNLVGSVWFGQQRLNHRLRVCVLAFANLQVANLSGLVDKVHRRPVAVVVGAPGLPIIIDRNSKIDIQAQKGVLDVFHIPFVSELRRVNANDYKTVIRVLLVPFPQRGNYVYAVVSPIGPEFDQYDVAPKVRQLQRFRVQPYLV